MALTPCRECNTEISERAKVCPHCGVNKPFQGAGARGFKTITDAMMGIGCLIILLPLLAALVAMVYALF